MKKARTLMVMLLTAFTVLSAVGCGSSDDSSTSSPSSQSEETSRTESPSKGTAAVEKSSEEDDEDGGIIDGVVNDMEKGAEDVKEGMDDMTGRTTESEEE